MENMVCLLFEIYYTDFQSSFTERVQLSRDRSNGDTPGYLPIH